MSKVFYVIDEFGFLPNKFVRPSPPILKLVPKQNRFPLENKIEILSFTVRETVPPTAYGTRAVRFKTQRPLYEKCEGDYERVARYYSGHDKR